MELNRNSDHSLRFPDPGFQLRRGTLRISGYEPLLYFAAIGAGIEQCEVARLQQYLMARL